MVDRSIESQLVNCLGTLPVNQQRQVLEFALSLRSQPMTGVPGSSLLRFAGAIDAADLDAMSAAICSECERIDRDEW